MLCAVVSTLCIWGIVIDERDSHHNGHIHPYELSNDHPLYGKISKQIYYAYMAHDTCTIHVNTLSSLSKIISPSQTCPQHLYISLIHLTYSAPPSPPTRPVASPAEVGWVFA